MLEKDILKILVTPEEIQQAVDRLGEQLTKDYEGEEVVVVGILRGAAIFMADIIRSMDTYLEIDFMDLASSIEGRHVLIVEDIIDSGRTLKYLVDLFHYRKAASVRICTLLEKKARRVVKGVEPDYIGIDIPDEFVVGYGLDYKQKYRNLPYIGVLKPEVYQ